MLHNDEYDDNIFDKYDTSTWTTTNNPTHYNIGAILSDRQHVLTFVNEIELANNSLSPNITLHPTAFEMSFNPVHTAQDVCDKLISKAVYAVIVSHPMNGFKSPTAVSFTCGFYKIPVIGISNRDSSLSNKNLHSTFLRTISPYSHQADVWIDMLLYMEYKSVIIIHSSDSDGRGTLSRFQNLADKSNIKVEYIIEYESGISNIRRELRYAQRNLYCRVFILYANSEDAEIIFTEIIQQEMDQTDYVWIVSEQALTTANKPDGILSLKLKRSEENVMIKDSVAILTNALWTMYTTANITKPPTACNTPIYPWQNGIMFYKLLMKQVHTGESGLIKFDDAGDRLFGEYEILNIINNTERPVGNYKFNAKEMKMELNLNLDQIEWPGHNNQKPLGYFVPSHLTITTLAERPFVWVKPFPFDQIECEDNQILCPKLNLTTNVEEDFCCEGYCIDLLKELASKLNFTYNLKVVADGQYGTYEFFDGFDKPRRWSGLVGELVNRKADMAVAPLTATPERSQVISFSKPFKYEGITVLQTRQPRKATLASFMQPFHGKLWLLVLISVHVVALALYMLDRFSPFGGYNVDDITNSDEGVLNLSSAIWFSWGVLLNSGIGERTPRSFSARVLGMVWAGFAMIVVASYTANLAAFLVLNPGDDHALSGVEDSRLRNPTEGFTFATVKGSAVDMFFRSQVHLFNAYRTMEETNRNSPEEAIDQLLKGELDAFIWDSPRLEYEAAQDCELAISGELFGRSGYGIGLQKNSFWTNEVTLALLRMHESGFMETLDNRWILGSEKECDAKIESFPNTLGMKNMAGVFILVFSGIVISFGLIVVEIIYKKRKLRKIQRLSIAKKMAIRWMIKVRKNRSKHSKNTSYQIATITKSNQEPHEKESEQDLFRYHSFSIPPPPPPPIVGQRIPSTYISGLGGPKKQRTAQQKIYEFKHQKSFGYY
ncbi:hypothetical protein RDWZM_000657 [Blomia tropicalis]|uniref:Glutamate [NMDA] receptor subunit 1 n=1 Tax=Blomia tropicalis TaxID=40697 RepID=A0A9Q0MAQ7_BLOTA|nr:hypothetical protein RDWZM_000657 [Blomia tropicalis]